MSRKRKPAPDPAVEGAAQAVLAIAQAGGMVLVGRDGHPFAFYPPRLPDDPRGLGDPGAPGRLREAVERRILEGRAEAIGAVKAGGLAVGRAG